MECLKPAFWVAIVAAVMTAVSSSLVGLARHADLPLAVSPSGPAGGELFAVVDGLARAGLATTLLVASTALALDSLVGLRLRLVAWLVPVAALAIIGGCRLLLGDGLWLRDVAGVAAIVLVTLAALPILAAATRAVFRPASRQRSSFERGAARLALVAVFATLVAGAVLVHPFTAPYVRGTLFETAGFHLGLGFAALFGIVTMFARSFETWTGRRLDRSLGSLYLAASSLAFVVLYGGFAVQGVQGAVRYSFQGVSPVALEVILTIAGVVAVMAQLFLGVVVLYSSLRGEVVDSEGSASGTANR